MQEGKENKEILAGEAIQDDEIKTVVGGRHIQVLESSQLSDKEALKTPLTDLAKGSLFPTFLRIDAQSAIVITAHTAGVKNTLGTFQISISDND